MPKLQMNVPQAMHLSPKVYSGVMPMIFLNMFRNVSFSKRFSSPSSAYSPRCSIRSKLNGFRQVRNDTRQYIEMLRIMAMNMISVELIGNLTGLIRHNIHGSKGPLKVSSRLDNPGISPIRSRNGYTWSGQLRCTSIPPPDMSPPVRIEA